MTPNYFELCLREFEQDPSLGIGGGLVCAMREGVLTTDYEGDPPFHVRGATKIYRRACWDQISPLLKAPGWDAIDEIKANMHGWKTRTFQQITILQHKPTGSADGFWRTWFKGGRGNYIAGYHPLFMLCKCVLKAMRRPFTVEALALLAGFTTGYIQRIPRVEDKEMIRFLRQQQLRALTLRRSIWSSPALGNSKTN